MTDSVPRLLAVIEAYCATADVAEATLSTKLFRDGKRIQTIRAGGDVGGRKIDAALRWLSENWPAGAVWPAGIDRPARTQASPKVQAAALA